MEAENPSLGIQGNSHEDNKEDPRPILDCKAVISLDVKPLREVRDGEIFEFEGEEDEIDIEENSEEEEGYNSSSSQDESATHSSIEEEDGEIEALDIEKMIRTTHENGMRCTFIDLVRAISLDTSFLEAWEKFSVKRLFMEIYISKDCV